jgi:hypothetical protein
MDKSTKPRKLAELWEVGGDYQIRVIVGAFQRELGATDPSQAEEMAQFEMIEVLRKIVADFDADEIQVRSDNVLPPL